MSVTKRKGSKFWQIDIGGVRTSSGTTNEEDAKTLEAKMRTEQWEANRLGVVAPRSWEEAVVRYEREKAGKATFKEQDLRIIRLLHPHFGGVKDLNQITRSWVCRIMEAYPGVSVSGRSPQNATVNRRTAIVRGILNLAEEDWEWGNKAPKLKMYKEMQRDDPRALTVEEWFKLEAVLPEHWRLSATFALATGLREAKVFGLTWESLAALDRAVAFKGNGNKLGNCIPLNQTALDVIEQCRALPIVSATHVFNFNGKPIFQHSMKTWKRAFVDADIPYARWHDLRVTFNSWLAEKGVMEETRKRLMGHSTGSVQDRYTLRQVEHLRPFVAYIDEVLSQAKAVKTARAA